MQKYLVLVVAFLAFFQVIAQDKNEEVSELIEKLVSEEIVVGVVAGYTVDGKTVGRSAAGFANKKTDRKFNLNTKLRLGSIAKPMTALAVMQLVEEGKLDLDTPIQTYIPEYPKQAKTAITTRHLLSHTSGVNGYLNNKDRQSTIEYPELSEALTIFKDRDLLFEPGTRYHYTTYGYTVLGVIVERVSGLKFEAYMQQNIWDKAGMIHTGVEKFGIKMENKSKLYHRKNGKKIKDGDENNLSDRIPGGGFYSTLGDILKFGNAVIDHTFVKESTLSLMREHHSLEKENNAYGFGWFLYNKKPNEGAIIGHPGGQTGSSAHLFLVPEKRAVAVVLANTSRSMTEVSGVANQLLRLSLEKSIEK